MIKYRADIADCNIDIRIIETQVSFAIRMTFVEQRAARYYGPRSFCSSITCSNIAVDFDKNTNCNLVTRRRKRALEYELGFMVSFANISTVISDSVQNEEMATRDIILLIIKLNAAQLQPSDLVGIVRYDSIGSIVSKGMCTPGHELLGDTCSPCPLGSRGTDGDTCLPCGVDTYQDQTGQADCKLCPANTNNQDPGAKGASACKDEEKSSPAVIIGASVAGGLTLLIVVVFIIYRPRKGSRKLPEEERSGRSDNDNPGNVYELPLDTETDIPNTKDEYEVIPADVNYFMTLKGDQSPAGPFLDTVQNVDSVSSERNVYTQLDVDRLNDRAKEYQQLTLKDHEDYLVPVRTEKIGNINTSNL